MIKLSSQLTTNSCFNCVMLSAYSTYTATCE